MEQMSTTTESHYEPLIDGNNFCLVNMANVTYYSSTNVSEILIAPHAVFSVLATILVGFRVYTSRVLAKSAWTIDEYICIVALFANHLMLICEGVAVPFGLGTDIKTIMTTYPAGAAAFLKVSDARAFLTEADQPGRSLPYWGLYSALWR
ncbi:hypothetical protein NW759_017211 [Fusarium solani]|nr:hypothetical protein NW759_017211 [Fusarium solani]